jgi:hypothetical protein
MATNNSCNYDPTQHAVIVGAANGAITSLAVGTTRQILTGNTTADPSYRSLSVTRQVFTSTGTYTPTAGMVYCDIEVIGGGGGGGGAAGSAAAFAAASGGGGGGYARGTFSSSTIGASQAVTIGAAGTAGTAGNNNGGDGGTTSVGALISATGGIHGLGSAAASNGAVDGGDGGAGSNGDFQTTGAPGGPGLIYSAISVGSWVSSGHGGNSFFGGGAKNISTPVTQAITGRAATSYGGGGGGGAQVATNTNVSGGAGAKGVVIVTEYVLS